MSSETKQILTTDGIPLELSLKKAERRNKIKAFLLVAPLLLFLIYGFLARVISGPTLSLFGLLATKIIVPYIEKLGVKEKLVPGPPKRFAQSIGLLLSAIALVFYLIDVSLVANSFISIILIFAILESCLSFCAGCYVFQRLMTWGLIPEDTCEKCNNISFNS